MKPAAPARAPEQFQLPSEIVLPSETRAVGEFVLRHENIAAFQSYHNFGGMTLQGPGQKDTPYAFQDAGIFEYIGKKELRSLFSMRIVCLKLKFRMLR